MLSYQCEWEKHAACLSREDADFPCDCACHIVELDRTNELLEILALRNVLRRAVKAEINDSTWRLDALKLLKNKPEANNG